MQDNPVVMECLDPIALVVANGLLVQGRTIIPVKNKDRLPSVDPHIVLTTTSSLDSLPGSWRSRAVVLQCDWIPEEPEKQSFLTFWPSGRCTLFSKNSQIYNTIKNTLETIQRITVTIRTKEELERTILMHKVMLECII